MSNDTRDADRDFLNALHAERRAYLVGGQEERAEAVAVELRARGVDIPLPAEKKVETPQVETKVPPAPQENAAAVPPAAPAAPPAAARKSAGQK